MGMIKRRKALMTMFSQELPPIYKKVDYIASSGTQYIKTGVYPSNNFGMDIDFYTECLLNGTDGQYGCLFGSRYSSGDNDCQLTTFTNNVGSYKGTLRFGQNWGTVKNAGIVRSTRQTASIRNLSFTNASGSIMSMSSYSWNSNKREIYLFLLNNNNSPTQGGTGCRIYSMKIYDGNSLIRNYVPCYRITDNVVGMYETVNKQFCTNQGSGSFSLPT